MPATSFARNSFCFIFIIFVINKKLKKISKNKVALVSPYYIKYLKVKVLVKSVHPFQRLAGTNRQIDKLNFKSKYFGISR